MWGAKFRSVSLKIYPLSTVSIHLGSSNQEGPDFPQLIQNASQSRPPTISLFNPLQAGLPGTVSKNSPLPAPPPMPLEPLGWQLPSWQYLPYWKVLCQGTDMSGLETAHVSCGQGLAATWCLLALLLTGI